MYKLTFLLLTAVLSACAHLPELGSDEDRPAKAAAAPSWLYPRLNQAEPAQLLLCHVESPRQACIEESRGLNAAGIGGIFLPLKVSLPVITIESGRADLQVTINGIDAACTTGSANRSDNNTLIKIGRVYCNWLVIGNVISTLTLSIDWEDSTNRTFGGRYAMSFIGTGNGAGSGFYSGKEQS